MRRQQQNPRQLHLTPHTAFQHKRILLVVAGGIAALRGVGHRRLGDPRCREALHLAQDAALDFHAVGHTDERRNGLDVVEPAHGEIGVRAMREPLEEGGIVLDEDRQCRPTGQLVEHRNDHPAGGALLLHHHDETIG